MTTVMALASGLARGSSIGSYRITARIGEGGMGVVYHAEHVLLGRPAAVKVLRPEVSHVAGVVQRFFNEARATTAIRHPGIVEIFDFGYTADRLAYIVMEWLNGSSLATALARGPSPLLATLVQMRRIVSALGAAHAAGVVHRDLKPDNIFLVPDPDGGDIAQIKVLDFGIAKLLEGGLAAPRQTATGVVIGTPVYMSPEQCRAADCDHRSDLYSLGCVLFEMIAGRPPFCGSSTGELLAAHLMETPPPLDRLVAGTPAIVGSLVARLLAKQPDDRPPSAAAVVAELDRLVETIAPDRRTAERATVLAPSLTGPVSAAMPAVPAPLSVPAIALDDLARTPATCDTGGPLLAPAPPRTRWARIAVTLGMSGAVATVATAALLRPRVPPPVAAPPPAFARGTSVDVKPDARPAAIVVEPPSAPIAVPAAAAAAPPAPPPPSTATNQRSPATGDPRAAPGRRAADDDHHSGDHRDDDDAQAPTTGVTRTLGKRRPDGLETIVR